MTLEEIRQAFVDQLDSTWATCSVIARPNKTFDPSNNGVWLKYKTLIGRPYEGEKRGVSIGTGIFHIDLNFPLDSGTRTSNIYAQRLEDGFRNESLGGVECEDPNSYEIGEVAGYYRIVVQVPFHYFKGE